jgi:hypothetical protein
MNTYKRHRFPQDIISYAAWLYYRFNLGHRDIEDLLAERSIIVSRDEIRLWCIKFGANYARRLKHGSNCKKGKGFLLGVEGAALRPNIYRIERWGISGRDGSKLKNGKGNRKPNWVRTPLCQDSCRYQYLYRRWLTVLIDVWTLTVTLSRA